MDLKILEIASNTEHNKVLKKHTHKSKNKNPICGDEMEISLMVENNKVIKIWDINVNHVFTVKHL